MPLSPPTSRAPVHTRAITCSSYRRGDGLWDVEGHLVDTTAFDFKHTHRGTIKAGDPIHDMWIRLTVDREMIVRQVEVVMDSTPYTICSAIAPAFAKLEGTRVGKGWHRKVVELLGGAGGCTHLVNLLRPVATVAFNTVRHSGESEGDVLHTGKGGRPFQIDSCHAYAADGKLARQRWPEIFTDE